MAILPPRTRSRAHWLIGTLGLVAFLGSGLVMHYGYAHLQGMDRATHLSFRSIHIYLLFSALLNLCVAPSAGPVTRGWAGGAAVLGSVLVLSGPVLLGIAFLEEPLDPSLDRSVTRLGVVACAAGTMLMTAGRWRRRRGRGRWPGARESDAA